ncbi:hypothetical protein CIP107546_02323 [Corynebacterium diphtheriae]|nr:hypothetical protein CDIPH_09995 [Corynebacterium diphtheriae]CAB0525785.1 hypothetical protein CIP107506_02083 [Corynebacterium diphtheriae]CAB0618888.1 hypothetical protein CIP107542_02070 [Corynebacterium diphtheriae]CAB0624219.1 hypothetical protein CIP107546_02323 [Corynebacterium diphtheriae]CAB0821146.1 hypothetical protein FRC0263_02362 [Corynebacterium diphtheriae]
MPNCFVGPVIFTASTVNHRVERGIMLFACEDVFGFLMLLITNTVRDSASGDDEEVQRLRASITRTLGHDVEERPVGCGVRRRRRQRC